MRLCPPPVIVHLFKAVHCEAVDLIYFRLLLPIVALCQSIPSSVGTVDISYHYSTPQPTMATMTRPHTTQIPQTAWSSHKYTESTDSETSFFDASTSTPSDTWVSTIYDVSFMYQPANVQQSGYFEGWDHQQTRDNYCPQIASPSDSPVRAGHASTPKFVDDDDELLPTARPHRRHRSEGNADAKHKRNKRATINTKRFGMVACADPQTGDEAITQLNTSLQNSMSNTEDILSAMYNPDWDVASLQKWYHQSSKTPADLALLKIMFSLRYTAEEIVPIS